MPSRSIFKYLHRSAAANIVAVAGTLMIMQPDCVLAVSGGGKDYATKDIRGEDFSGQSLVNKGLS